MKLILYFAKLPVDAGKYSCYNNNMDKMKYNFTCRLFTDTKCFGPGVAQLLHTVDRLHSLRAAAAEMEMAYSKAWRIIRTAEEVFGCKLLDSTIGGRHGGGAVLTPQAERLLAAYNDYVAEVTAFSESKFNQHFWFYQELDKDL